MKSLLMKSLFLIGRILFGGFFLAAGLNHFMHHAAMARMVARGGIPMPELAVIGSGLLIFVGGASILLGFRPRVGCLLIIIFLTAVTPLAHNFWAHSNPAQRADDLNNFTKNAGLLGGALMMLILPQSWPWSVDAVVALLRPAHSRQST
jgi:putative oxidoreductase